MIDGLYDKAGKGRKRIFTESEEYMIKEFAENFDFYEKRSLW